MYPSRILLVTWRTIPEDRARGLSFTKPKLTKIFTTELIFEPSSGVRLWRSLRSDFQRTGIASVSNTYLDARLTSSCSVFAQIKDDLVVRNLTMIKSIDSSPWIVPLGILRWVIKHGHEPPPRYDIVVSKEYGEAFDIPIRQQTSQMIPSIYLKERRTIPGHQSIPLPAKRKASSDNPIQNLSFPKSYRLRRRQDRIALHDQTQEKHPSIRLGVKRE